MARKDPQFQLRMPQDLKSQVETAATINNRSINAEIVARLEASVSASYKVIAPPDGWENEKFLEGWLNERAQELYILISVVKTEDRPLFVFRVGSTRKLSVGELLAMADNPYYQYKDKLKNESEKEE